jgi:hypothetical protein
MKSSVVLCSYVLLCLNLLLRLTFAHIPLISFGVTECKQTSLCTLSKLARLTVDIYSLDKYNQPHRFSHIYII